MIANKITATATLPSTTLVNGVAVGNTSEFSAVFTVSNNTPLPVELTDFTVDAVKNDAALVWHTASEKNNDHFEIERSLTGLAFEKIGEVKGRGNSSAPMAYGLTDAGIGLRAAGVVYYRLKQVDLDGLANYSPIRTVRFVSSAAAPSLTFWPNPATSGTQLDLTQLPAGAYRVCVLDAMGRLVLAVSLDAGLVHPLDLNTIANGTYLVLVSGQANGQPLKLTTRLIKE